MSWPWSMVLGILALVLLTIGTVWGLVYAPVDYQQGNSYRIIYIHVPTAILAQSCYFMMAVLGTISLVWRMKMADMVLKSIVPFGAVICLLALITGAVWGKPTWGTWWVWDARLTSMLIQLFLYLGVLAIYNVMESQQSADKSAAVLSLVGVINIPIIKYSVNWWNTLHQPATFKLTEKPAMPAEMWIPLLVMVLGTYCFFGSQVLIRTRQEILQRERKTNWVREEVKRLGGVS
ncbi:ABC-type transport system involved in cytochrome c biogenesis, permease component [Gynuella sunshinyii YC6258]|uniref:Heme exporter protein C n=2 Tax=Gynuella sunshinyii TaxID=1445505 RepID=A0A0C5W238_9GAMM|nr:heme ABC transporter permease [Gynuella sunshinyii]AJQ96724.1 ABC-type transport system involved in cytochrome c biogenesis, permease component [Gynuella sunshinyii YC6258]